MKCPNCGAEMKEGTLYCEHCGEDIHIVPDFEPEIEYNMEQTLIDIARGMKPVADVEDSMQEAAELQDWDEISEDHVSRHPFRWKFIVLALVLVVVAIVCTGFGISYSHYHSAEYQTKCARDYVDAEEYEQAITCYERALEIAPENITLKFELADIYFKKNNKIEYEYLLREIVTDPAATAEQLESAYGKLIAIYAAREDYKTINDLLLDSGNVSIMSKYQSYMAMEPEFSLQEGYYTSIQPLKLTTFGSGKIYYTMDGSEPGENSSLYTAPILLH